MIITVCKYFNNKNLFHINIVLKWKLEPKLKLFCNLMIIELLIISLSKKDYIINV